MCGSTRHLSATVTSGAFRKARTTCRQVFHIGARAGADAAARHRGYWVIPKPRMVDCDTLITKDGSIELAGIDYPRPPTLRRCTQVAERRDKLSSAIPRLLEEIRSRCIGRHRPTMILSGWATHIRGCNAASERIRRHVTLDVRKWRIETITGGAAEGPRSPVWRARPVRRGNLKKVEAHAAG